MSDQDNLKTKIDKLDRLRKQLRRDRDRVLPFFILIPIFVAAFAFIASRHPVVMGFAAFVSAFTSYGIYYSKYITQFERIKSNFKSELIANFMKTYHPEIHYSYSSTGTKGSSIINSSPLANVDRVTEEDVVQGSKGSTQFYISEVHLENKNDDNYTTELKGILFRIKTKERNLPKAIITSKVGIIESIFGRKKVEENLGFRINIDSSTPGYFRLQRLFPFISHLVKRQRDVRIQTDGDTITILMASRMAFLDDPELLMERSLHDEGYYSTMTQQLNSLLYIAEAFDEEGDPEEQVEKLELKMLEYAKNQKLK